MDKKKKILSIAAVVLVGGLAALSATGGISNLRSSSLWIDNGDGTGYWSTDSDSSDGVAQDGEFFDFLPQIEAKIESLKSQISQKKLTLIEAEKQIEILNKKKVELLQAVAKENENMTLNLSLKTASAGINLYTCTNNAAYKTKGYVYADPTTYDARYQELGEKITSLNNKINTESNQTIKKIADENTLTNSKISAINKDVVEKTTPLYQKKTELSKQYSAAKPADKTKINIEIQKVQKEIDALIKNGAIQTSELKSKLTQFTNSLNSANAAAVKNYKAEIQKAQDEKTAMDKNPKCVANARTFLVSQEKILEQIQAKVKAAEDNLQSHNAIIAEKEAKAAQIKEELSDIEEQLKEAEEQAKKIKEGRGTINDPSEECIGKDGIRYTAECHRKVPGYCANETGVVIDPLVYDQNDPPVGRWSCGFNRINKVTKQPYTCGVVQCSTAMRDSTGDMIDTICEQAASKNYQGCSQISSPCNIDSVRHGNKTNTYDCNGIMCSVSNEICTGNGKRCGDNIIDEQWLETCDDGNNNNGDGCSSTCTKEIGGYCGDSLVQSENLEECDDGNRENGDGCDATCLVELKEGEAKGI